MKKLLIAIGFAAGIVLVALAADPRGRVDTRMLAGVQNFVQDEMDRTRKPVIVAGLLYYSAVNPTDGVIFCRSNSTVLVHVGLPNPTNNYGRRYEVSTLGACTAVLSNSTVVGDFTDMFTLTNASVYAVASNKTAVAYSTGTNWAVRLY